MHGRFYSRHFTHGTAGAFLPCERILNKNCTKYIYIIILACCDVCGVGGKEWSERKVLKNMNFFSY